jgi:hypothetical protein
MVLDMALAVLVEFVILGVERRLKVTWSRER